jgi:hypothetical protein
MNFEFKPATDYALPPPLLFDGEVAMVDACIRPNSPEGRMRESLVLDRVVGDMDVSARLVNLQLMLPMTVPLADLQVPASAALLWDVYVRNLQVAEYASEVAYDTRAGLYRVVYNAPREGVQTFRVTSHVIIEATKLDIISFWIGTKQPLT